MSDQTSIADSLDKDGIMVEPMTPAPDGVPAPEPVAVPTAGGTPGIAAQGTSDAGADFEAKLADARAEFDRNLRRMQSSLQSNAARERQESEQRMSQLEQELFNARTAGMNDQDRAVYERDMYAQRAQMLEEQYRQSQQRLYDWEQGKQARDAFEQFGISPNKLPTGPVEDVLRAGWQSTAELVAQLRTDLAAAKAAQPTTATTPTAPAPTAPGLVQPPATASAQGVPTGGRTWGEAYKAASDILGTPIDNEEDLIKMVEGGHLPPSILPGLG